MIVKAYLAKYSAMFLCVATPVAVVVKDPGPRTKHYVSQAKKRINQVSKRVINRPIVKEDIVPAKEIETREICPPTSVGSTTGIGYPFLGGGYSVAYPSYGITPPSRIPGTPSIGITPIAKPVPEPAVYGTMALGLGMAGYMTKRRRKTK